MAIPRQDAFACRQLGVTHTFDGESTFLKELKSNEIKGRAEYITDEEERAR